jgi:hypothetical protein
MAVRITITNLQAIGAVGDRIKQVLGAAILDLDNDLRRNSPVDTGYFVNSWQAQANGSPEAQPGHDGAREGSGGDAATIFAGVAKGAVVSLVNTAVYAPRLADGYSPQAPAGWVESAANRLQDHVDRNVLESRDS